VILINYIKWYEYIHFVTSISWILWSFACIHKYILGSWCDDSDNEWTQKFPVESFSWLQRTLKDYYYWTLKKWFCVEPFTGSKYVVLIEPFKVLYRTFSSKNVSFIEPQWTLFSKSECLYKNEMYKRYTIKFPSTKAKVNLNVITPF